MNASWQNIEPSKRVYLGNLSYTTTANDIEKVLWEHGLGHCSQVHMLRKPISQLSWGYCFVNFTTREVASRALTSLQGIVVDRRPLRVEPPQQLLGPYKTPLEVSRLYVGGLGPVMNQEENDIEIWWIFNGFEISAIGERTPAYSASLPWGNPPGNRYGVYVDFWTTDEAKRARRAINGMPYGDGKLHVFYATNFP
ncbi:hypothetical protein QBC47DRAFT_338652 [Echria macrotheca]|uniref:RRM domain-containing protein n=1 Tax=Echria macrotheca TaxID=438768 RepID=A0AAJ0FC51_9PEZI|nr:hypothetical protein QBC47DRAFT_338652 [Echria macrotheca]